ncbi:MAG: DNA alkylation repair protein [Chloroflexi bacterium]|nr:DNA alkylation repair protein [Chloroflexota bacterium]
MHDFWQMLEFEILRHRVKFPLLEFVARELFRFVPQAEQLGIVNKLLTMDYEGGYVIIGIILQERLAINKSESVQKAAVCIIEGNKWYVCDIISERVFGHGLLHDFSGVEGLLRPFLTHPNVWMQRAVGIATHYATKKGLRQEDVDRLFSLLLPLASSRQMHVKKGVGWAFKTIAKFHPELVRPRLDGVLADTAVTPWCKNKLKIGLAMADKR